MRIGFWLTTPRRFDPAKVWETTFGGAEMSALNLATDLAKNHDVFMFGNISVNVFDRIHFGSTWYGYDELWGVSDLLEVLIVVRADPNLLNPRVNAQYFGDTKPPVVLWTGDAYDQPNNQIFHDRFALRGIERIVVKSKWQKETLEQHFPLLANQTVSVMYNGVPDEIPESSYPEEPRFVCASTIYRGVHRFLEIWPMVRKEIPEATLDLYCKKSLYGFGEDDGNQDFTRLYEQLDALPGVAVKEPLPQRELHKELVKYRAMLYPNCGFVESSCGVVLEAMAIGMPVIASLRAGLGETVSNESSGHCVVGNPETTRYAEDFAGLVWDVNNNPEIFYWGERTRLDILKRQAWSKVAERWEKLLDQTVRTQRSSRGCSLESSLEAA